jgi:hypothetical protein
MFPSNLGFMGRISTIPTLIEECRSISISDLKKWKYLKPNSHNSGVITWSRQGRKTASIGIAVNMRSNTPYLKLNYNLNDKTINYKIELESIESNIGNGIIWYFKCPATNKRCRKLISIGGLFYHRTAFKGWFYEKQTYSKRMRRFINRFGGAYEIDKLCELLYAKNFKRYYAGKPTKRYLKLKAKIEEHERISLEEIEKNLMIW